MDAEALAQNLAGKTGAMTTLVDRVDAQLLARCPDLKAVCNIAVGFNNIDLPACTKARVMATNTPGCWTTAPRISPGADPVHGPPGGGVRCARARRAVEGLVPEAVPGRDVHHATWASWASAASAAGWPAGRRVDMKVVYHDAQRTNIEAERGNAASVGIDELWLRRILTIHAPYSPATHRVVGARELQRCSPGVLIHASRGGRGRRALVRPEKRPAGGAGINVFGRGRSATRPFSV